MTLTHPNPNPNLNPNQAPIPEEEDNQAPQSMLEAIAAGFFDALPHLLIVLYGVSPTAYNKAFSMYQCVTYEEMPESDEWYTSLLSLPLPEP